MKKGVSKYSEYLSKGMSYDKAMYWYRKDHRLCTECAIKLNNSQKGLCDVCRSRVRKNANKHYHTGKTYRYQRICQNENCPLEDHIFYAHMKDNKFCSTKCMGEWQSKYKRGKNSNSWNPDRSNVRAIEAIRDLIEMDIWKMAVKKRDGYICQMCGYYKGGILESHHIISISDMIDSLVDSEKQQIINKDLSIELYDKFFNLNNGICLCKECHKKTYRKEKEYAQLFMQIRDTKYALSII